MDDLQQETKLNFANGQKSPAWEHYNLHKDSIIPLFDGDPLHYLPENQNSFDDLEEFEQNR